MVVMAVPAAAHSALHTEGRRLLCKRHRHLPDRGRGRRRPTSASGSAASLPTCGCGWSIAPRSPISCWSMTSARANPTPAALGTAIQTVKLDAETPSPDVTVRLSAEPGRSGLHALRPFGAVLAAGRRGAVGRDAGRPSDAAKWRRRSFAKIPLDGVSAPSTIRRIARAGTGESQGSPDQMAGKHIQESGRRGGADGRTCGGQGAGVDRASVQSRARGARATASVRRVLAVRAALDVHRHRRSGRRLGAVLAPLQRQRDDLRSVAVRDRRRRAVLHRLRRRC